MNSAAVNTGVNLSFHIMVCSGYMPGSGIAGSYGGSIFSFLGISTAFSVMVVPIYISISSVGWFSTPSPAFIVYRFFDDGHSDWQEIIVLHFSNNQQYWAKGWFLKRKGLKLEVAVLFERHIGSNGHWSGGGRGVTRFLLLSSSL